MIHTIRLSAEPSTGPGLQWLRLMLDERNGHAEALDEIVANFSAPIAISDPECTCDIATTGQPARGWVNTLQVRAGLEGSELWAGVAWIDQLKDVCANGTLWARVIVDENAVHPVSGAQLGAKLRSIEFTAPPSLLASQKETMTMTTATTTTTTTTLLAALPRFRKEAPNDCIALERAARELLPEAKSMSHQDLYRDIVHPAIVALGAQKFVAASNRAGATVRASSASSEAAATSKVDPSKPVLDVSRYVGEPTTFARIMAHVRTMNPGLNHDKTHELASNLSRSHTIVG
jgi:hypothetical protein